MAGQRPPQMTASSLSAQRSQIRDGPVVPVTVTFAPQRQRRVWVTGLMSYMTFSLPRHDRRGRPSLLPRGTAPAAFTVRGGGRCVPRQDHGQRASRPASSTGIMRKAASVRPPNVCRLPEPEGP